MKTTLTKVLSLIVFIVISNIASVQNFGTLTKVEVGINGLGVALEVYRLQIYLRLNMQSVLDQVMT